MHSTLLKLLEWVCKSECEPWCEPISRPKWHLNNQFLYIEPSLSTKHWLYDISPVMVSHSYTKNTSCLFWSSPSPGNCREFRVAFGVAGEKKAACGWWFVCVAWFSGWPLTQQALPTCSDHRHPPPPSHPTPAYPLHPDTPHCRPPIDRLINKP